MQNFTSVDIVARYKIIPLVIFVWFQRQLTVGFFSFLSIGSPWIWCIKYIHYNIFGCIIIYTHRI